MIFGLSLGALIGLIPIIASIGPEWTAALGGVASAAIAALGLLLIWRQVSMGTVALREQAEAAKDISKARLLDLSEPINRLLFEHPELYDPSYLGDTAHVPAPGSDLWKRAMILCEMQGNYIEFVVRAVDSLSRPEKIAWQNFVRDTFDRPTFQVFWSMRAHWYDPAIEAFARGENGEFAREGGNDKGHALAIPAPLGHHAGGKGTAMRRPLSEALAPGLSSLVFIVIPLGILIATGSLNWIGWASLAFGALGLFASVALVMGWQIGPDPAHRGKARPAPRKPVRHKGDLPILSPSRQGQTRRAIQTMADAGVFAPQAPDPAMLYPGVAEMDETVKPDTILLALVEADYYHTGFDPQSYMANLVLHDIQVEALPDYYEQVVADLVRLSRGALSVTDLAITQTDSPTDAGAVRTHIAMTLNGEPLAIEADHHVKYFHGFIHEALAARMPADLRLAWLWVDQGAFVTALPPRAVEAMNAAFKLTDKSRCQWEWIPPPPQE